MRTHGWWLGAMLCWGLMAPVSAAAQADESPDIIRAIFSPNWRISVHGGPTHYGRFLLQRPAGLPSDRERALTSETGWDIGLAAGMDLVQRVGLRLSYTYATADLTFRDNSGDGSEALDLDGMGGLANHMASIEIVTILLPGQAVTPYATAGFIGSWWVLSEENALVPGASDDTQFRSGAIASIGLVAKLTERIDGRLEVASASTRNPFTGTDSFRAFGGTTIDEPTRVGKTDFRLGFGYRFGSLNPPGVPVD